jgi:hypothetical protein
MSSSTLINPSERTPLLKSHSQSAIPIPYDQNHDGSSDRDSLDGYGDDGPKGREVEVYKPGKSSFMQTVSNFVLSCLYRNQDQDQIQRPMTTDLQSME